MDKKEFKVNPSIVKENISDYLNNPKPLIIYSKQPHLVSAFIPLMLRKYTPIDNKKALLLLTSEKAYSDRKKMNELLAIHSKKKDLIIANKETLLIDNFITKSHQLSLYATEKLIPVFNRNHTIIFDDILQFIPQDNSDTASKIHIKMKVFIERLTELSIENNTKFIILSDDLKFVSPYKTSKKIDVIRADSHTNITSKISNIKAFFHKDLNTKSDERNAEKKYDIKLTKDYAKNHFHRKQNSKYIFKVGGLDTKTSLGKAGETLFFTINNSKDYTKYAIQSILINAPLKYDFLYISPFTNTNNVKKEQEKIDKIIPFDTKKIKRTTLVCAESYSKYQDKTNKETLLLFIEETIKKYRQDKVLTEDEAIIIVLDLWEINKYFNDFNKHIITWFAEIYNAYILVGISNDENVIIDEKKQSILKLETSKNKTKRIEN